MAYKENENWIYISHLDEEYRYWFLPTEPDSLQDSMNSTFQSTQALGRSAPVYTFSNSGPRTVQFTFVFNRDLFDEVNMNASNSKLNYNYDADYLDNLIKAMQSIAVPKYNLTNKAVEPPLVAIRIGKQLFVKGIVTGGVTVTYEKPILENDLWSKVTIGFQVSEVDPYDAGSIFKNGSFRGMVSTLKGGMNL